MSKPTQYMVFLRSADKVLVCPDSDNNMGLPRGSVGGHAHRQYVLNDIMERTGYFISFMYPVLLLPHGQEIIQVWVAPDYLPPEQSKLYPSNRMVTLPKLVSWDEGEWSSVYWRIIENLVHRANFLMEQHVKLIGLSQVVDLTRKGS